MEPPLSLHAFPRAILHIDGDAFFASYEQSRRPKLQGRPVVTGKERGIAASMSYEAKARGVRRGMRLAEIWNVCPEAVILPFDSAPSRLLSRRFVAMVRRETPEVEAEAVDPCVAEGTTVRRPPQLSSVQSAQRSHTMWKPALPTGKRQRVPARRSVACGADAAPHRRAARGASLCTRQACRVRSSDTPRSLHPMQDVPDDRPARRFGHRMLPQNPVVVQQRNRPVVLLQREPELQKVGQVPLPTGQRVGQRHRQDVRLGNRHTVGGVAERPG